MSSNKKEKEQKSVGFFIEFTSESLSLFRFWFYELFMHGVKLHCKTLNVIFHAIISLIKMILLYQKLQLLLGLQRELRKEKETIIGLVEPVFLLCENSDSLLLIIVLESVL